MKSIVLLVVFNVVVLAYGQGIVVEESVVKIFSASQSYNFTEPWKSNSIKRSTATGFVIENNRILTNAHAVANCKYLQVQFGNSSKKVNAEVEYMSDDYDLAILKLEETANIPELTALEFETSLKLKDKIEVYGYPVGGDKLSVTEGIVSRIQTHKYAFSQKYFTVIQTDAAINPGNSGGPVLKEGKVVGVAFQGRRMANNIGYVIPSHIIKHFLNDIKDGEYNGVPRLGIKVLFLESSIHREMLGMKEEETGILIKSVDAYSSFINVLEKNDVILKIDNKEIGVDGSIVFSKNSRIDLRYLLEYKNFGDEIVVEILRGKKRITKKVKLLVPKKNDVVENYSSSSQPSYYITSGFIFEKLSVNYLNKYIRAYRMPKDAPYDLIKIIGKSPDDIEELVFIVSVLPDVSNEGFQSLKNIGISEINGIKVKNFVHFIELLKKERYAVLTDLNGSQIIIDNEMSKKRDEEIQKTYNISSLVSSDLLGN